MAENWPRESSSSRAPPTCSTRTSPLQSGSSQSSHEAPAVAAAELDWTTTTTTLVETLRACLATAAPTERATTVTAVTAVTPPAAERSDPLRQPLRAGSGSRTGMKRRSRASRRVPTTVVEATCSDFRETVHRLTGIPTPTPVSAPVRPQPQRAFPRPPPQPTARAPPTPRPQLLNYNPLLHITEAPPPMYPAFSNPQQHLDPELDPTFVKSESSPAEGFEPGVGGLSQSGLASTMSQLVSSAPSGSIQTWWDAGPQPQSQSLFMNPNTTTGPFDSSGTSASGPILHDDFDVDWFQQDHSGSDYMR